VLEPRDTVPRRNAEGQQLDVSISRAEAEQEASTGKVVDDARVLRQAERVIQRGQGHRRPEADRLGLARQGSQQDERRGEVSVARQVMLAHPCRVQTGVLGGDDRFDQQLQLGRRFGRAPPERLRRQRPDSEPDPGRHPRITRWPVG
jgi:hypothetical protein